MNITENFLDIITSVSANPLPDSVAKAARMCILDYLGCVLVGGNIISEKEKNFISLVSRQGGNSSAIGLPDRLSLHNAAFVNGMRAHAAELDDGHRYGMLHLGGSILSALLPVAELEQISSRDLLSGVVAGYEAAVRMAMAMQPSHKVRGYHTSGTCGTIGAAMSIAVAMHQDRAQMRSTLAAATASASGLLELQEDKSEMKPYNLAQASVNGIVAAYAGMAGFVGPDDPVGGKRGILNVMAENPKLEMLSEPFDKCCIETIYRKHYAACRHCHPAIEAALSIRNEQGISASDIRSINVETYKLAVGGHDHKTVQGIASAKLSIPFSVALALVKGDAAMEDFSEANIADGDILALAEKVNVSINDTLTSWSPEKRAAIVTIETVTGDSFIKEIDYPRGEPENPMTRKEVEEKFITLAVAAGVPLPRCEYVVSMFDSGLFTVAEVFQKLR